MSFALLIAAVAVLPAVFALPSANVDLQLNRRQIADPNNLPANWTLVGCFSDAAPASRTLLEAQSPDNAAMTPLLCTEFCSGSDFPTPFNFAGTEFTSQCFCDFNIQGTATKLADTACDFPCGGDANLTCGGASVISVYQNHNANVGPIPTNKATVGTWAFEGCITDAVGNNTRSLTIRLPISVAEVTIESCTAGCQSNGFSIAGLEFGQECWCGNSLLVPNVTAPLTDCSQACVADHTELCGAPFRLSLYSNTAVVTTVVPTTVVPTTVVPTTVVPTTVVPTTVVPTTVVPTTVVPTTVAPTTVKPTTTATVATTKAG
ncbi:WSC domain-containing protein [Pholiota molesta]|nr:WSC domain-containing protein [Pholiota molesta]